MNLIFTDLNDQCTAEEESCYHVTGNSHENELKCSAQNKCECGDKFKLEDGVCKSGAVQIIAKYSAVVILIISAFIF